MSPKYSQILLWPPPPLISTKSWYPNFFSFFWNPPKNLKFKFSNPQKMIRAYDCMKISEYPPGIATCTIYEGLMEDEYHCLLNVVTLDKQSLYLLTDWPTDWPTYLPTYLPSYTNFDINQFILCIFCLLIFRCQIKVHKVNFKAKRYTSTQY